MKWDEFKENRAGVVKNHKIAIFAVRRVLFVPEMGAGLLSQNPPRPD